MFDVETAAVEPIHYVLDAETGVFFSYQASPVSGEWVETPEDKE